MVIALGGHDFIGPTIAGDDNEAKPISDEKVEVVRTIAKTLTKCRRNCVLLPPPGTKFGVGPIFDDNTVQIARILDEYGIVYYRPAMWTQLQIHEQHYPLDTLDNRRVYMRLFQCLMYEIIIVTMGVPCRPNWGKDNDFARTIAIRPSSSHRLLSAPRRKR